MRNVVENENTSAKDFSLALQPHTNNFSLQPGAPLLSFPGAALIRCAQFLCRSQQPSSCSDSATSSRQTARCCYRLTVRNAEQSLSLTGISPVAYIFTCFQVLRCPVACTGVLELCNMRCRADKIDIYWDVIPCSLVDVIDVSEEFTACNFRTEE